LCELEPNKKEGKDEMEYLTKEKFNRSSF